MDSVQLLGAWTEQACDCIHLLGMLQVALCFAFHFWISAESGCIKLIILEGAVGFRNHLKKKNLHLNIFFLTLVKFNF